MINPLPDHTSLEPLELADTLHHQADEVLARIHLAEIVQPYGPLTPTGSYASFPQPYDPSLTPADHPL